MTSEQGTTRAARDLYSHIRHAGDDRRVRPCQRVSARNENGLRHTRYGLRQRQTSRQGNGPTDLDGKPLPGTEGPPVEWPIHTALHGARADALAVAHLHTPYATLFAIAKRDFEPVTLQGAIFSDGVPLYPEAQLITNPERGDALLKSIGNNRAAAVARPRHRRRRQSLPEVLFASLVLEDDAKKTMQAAALGESATSARMNAKLSAPRSPSSAAPSALGTIFVAWNRSGISKPPPGEANCFRRTGKIPFKTFKIPLVQPPKSV